MKKKIWMIGMSLSLMSVLFAGTIVLADHDDDDDDRYEYEHDDDHDDRDYDDDDDYEYDDDEEIYYVDESTTALGEVGTWNVWTRTLIGAKGDIPFSEAQNVQMTRTDTNTTMDVYVIPKSGELFVPGKKIAQFLGADAAFYPTSQILRMINANQELVFRANTNVAYENRVKTPIPALAFYLNEDVYLPISVVVNGLGYYVEWQDETRTFVCQKL